MQFRILFISRGSLSKSSSIIKSQERSLTEIGHCVEHFIISGKGILAYFKAISKLSSLLNSNQYHLIHIHFSYSAIPYLFLRTRPWVVSFMGSDINRSKINLWFSRFISSLADASIVKSSQMKTLLNRQCHIIPNGVDVNFFQPLNQKNSRMRIGVNTSGKVILFAANPSRPEKNFALTKKALDSLNADNEIELITLNNVDFELMPFYYNAADVVLLSSKYEGSPNVVKEAMACNRPVVTTNVGDVDNYRDVNGVFISSDDPSDFAKSIVKAIQASTSDGRNYVIENLSKDKIARQLHEVYLQLK